MTHPGPRLIPAHAGKTRQGRGSRSTRWAHPRSRGENSDSLTAATTLTGSSPLTRGKRTETWGWLPETRLIPAHAGKTIISPISQPRWSAHPRSRGENTLLSSRLKTRNGSSPLTRGKRRQVRCGVPPGRLIPAHAGKTQHAILIVPNPTAHPRSRGENIRARTPKASLLGSSPLTRGKHVQEIALAPVLGLIPAHAGKTALTSCVSSAYTAHPRSRGENTADDALTQQPAGSSPLTRGKRSVDW